MTNELMYEIKTISKLDKIDCILLQKRVTANINL